MTYRGLGIERVADGFRAMGGGEEVIEIGRNVVAAVERVERAQRGIVHALAALHAGIARLESTDLGKEGRR